MVTADPAWSVAPKLVMEPLKIHTQFIKVTTEIRKVWSPVAWSLHGMATHVVIRHRQRIGRARTTALRDLDIPTAHAQLVAVAAILVISDAATLKNSSDFFRGSSTPPLRLWNNKK